MGAVASGATATQTSAELESQGLVVKVAVDGTYAVTFDVPKAIGPEVRGALEWRRDAMRAAHAKGTGQPWQRPALAARAGVQVDRGWCISCGEKHAGAGNGGDCLLCIAARVLVLKAAGAIGPGAGGCAGASPLALER